MICAKGQEVTRQIAMNRGLRTYNANLKKIAVHLTYLLVKWQLFKDIILKTPKEL